MNSAEFSREIGLNSAEFFRSKKGSSNSAENMNSYEFTFPFLSLSLHRRELSQIISSTRIINLMEAESVACASAAAATATAADLDGAIEWLCNLSPEDLVNAKGSSKLSKISLTKVKDLATHLSMNRCYNKSVLTDNIIKKRKRASELASIHISEAAEQDSDDDESSRFVSNVNTFPRICNIILDDALIRSALLASKYASQNKETN